MSSAPTWPGYALSSIADLPPVTSAETSTRLLARGRTAARMGDGRSARRMTVLSSTWGRRDELAFVVRSLTGAASRVVDVDVLVPGTPGQPRADGLFDLVPVGPPTAGETWPTIDNAAWPATFTPDVVLLDRADSGAVALAER